MKIGNNTISNCKIGNAQVKEIRIGTTLIWTYDIVLDIVTEFKARATSLNCFFEAEACLVTTLNNLNT
jgi:hypothetical protein